MARKRLTITIKDELLDLLDNTIDGSKIRNRSHAFEYLLTKYLIPEATRVLVLTGGNGIKLRPITYEIPKCLIPIHDKPLVEYTFENLKKSNLTDITLSTGRLGDKIEKQFGDGSLYNLDIKYKKVDKKNPGTSYPVYQTKNDFSDKPFVLIYGDVLADIDYLDLIEYHKSHRGIATIALASVEKPSEWGVVDMKGNRIVRFTEKPNKKVKSHLINAGIYVLDPSVFKYIKKDHKMLEKDLFPRLAQEGKLYGYPFEGQWFDVGTPEIYEEVLKKWKGWKNK